MSDSKQMVERILITFPTSLGKMDWDKDVIVYFEALGDQTILHGSVSTVHPKTILYRRLGEVEAYLATTPAKDDFLRVHKSYLVNLSHVRAALPVDSSSTAKDLVLHLSEAKTCPCSRTYKHDFHRAMERLAEREGGSWKKQGNSWKRS